MTTPGDNDRDGEHLDSQRDPLDHLVNHFDHVIAWIHGFCAPFILLSECISVAARRSTA